MEPRRVKPGWLDLCAPCIVIRDTDLLTFRILCITAALLLGNGFMPEQTKAKRPLSLIAQVRSIVLKLDSISLGLFRPVLLLLLLLIFFGFLLSRGGLRSPHHPSITIKPALTQWRTLTSLWRQFSQFIDRIQIPLKVAIKPKIIKL